MQMRCYTLTRLMIAAVLVLHVPLLAGTGGGPFVSGFLHGTDGGEVITGMDRFSNGDVVVCGYLPYATESWDGAPGFDHTYNGGDDAFIAVLNADLTTVKAFTLFGGIENDRATAVVVRDDETIIVTGTTRSADLPVSSGSIAPIYSAGVDGFLVAFNNVLTDVQFGTYIVGSGDEHPMNIALDEGGSIYLCGTTTSISGFPTNNGYDQQYEGGTDGFVMRISPNGASIQFSTYYGSEGYDEIRDIQLDNSGSVYLAGTTQSASFPTFPYVDARWWWRFRERPYDWTYNGGLSDAFLLILSEDGAQCIVATYFGGEGDDVATGIVVQDGEVMLVGTTTSPDLLTEGGQQGYLNGESDAFIASFDPKGRTMKGATYFGGAGSETVHGAVPGPSNNVLLWGVTTSRDLRTAGYGSRQQIYGPEDAFFATIGVGSASLVSAIGGSALDTLARCFVEPDGSILMAGHSLSRQVPLDTGVLLHRGPLNTSNAMVVRFAPGLIDLTSPIDRQLKCDGQNLTVSFSRIEMRDADRFLIEASRDQVEWETVLGPTDRTNVVWTIDDPQYIGHDLYVRVRSNRRHVSWSPDPIRVDPAPAIVRGPDERVSACAGAALELSVDATGNGLSYQWRHNGKPVPGQTQPILQRSSVSTLDAGTYQVIVSATCGAEVVTEQTTVVIVEQMQITQHPEDRTVTQGKSVTLTCRAEGSNVTYQWYHNDELLAGRTQQALTIPSASLSDSGEYHCSVSSDCGEALSNVAKLTVEPTVSVAEVGGQETSIYVVGPHPVREILTVKATSAEALDGPFAVYDVTGHAVIRGSSNGSSHVVTLPIDLPTGAYVFVIGRTRLPFLALRP